MTTTIPTIDFAPWHTPTSPTSRQDVANSLTEACRLYGFAYIINHDVPIPLLNEAFSYSQRLFALSHEEKMQAPRPKGPLVHRGYSWPGLEKVTQRTGKEEDEDLAEVRGVSDYKESYEVGSELNTSQPNIWLPPHTIPGFQPFMQDFYKRLHRTAQEILLALGMGLDLKDVAYLKDSHSGVNNQLRLLHYPPIAAQEIESGRQVRLDAHSDWGCITMVFQDECGGLEVEDPREKGKWIEVLPIRNAIVMNIGDALMRWSNDNLKSTLHRVQLPTLPDRITTPERITRARYSIPYFVAPDVEHVVECLPECVKEGEKKKYEPLNYGDYMHMRMAANYES